jgi:hypothetical protein
MLRRIAFSGGEPAVRIQKRAEMPVVVNFALERWRGKRQGQTPISRERPWFQIFNVRNRRQSLFRMCLKRKIAHYRMPDRG